MTITGYEARTEHHKLASAGLRAVAMRVRDEGFEFEANDCVVKALQAVTGVPYRDAHAFVAREFKRKNGRGVNVSSTLGLFNRQARIIFGYRIFCKPVEVVGVRVSRSTRFWNKVSRNVYATLSQFARTHPTGRFLLCSRSHAFALVNGTIYDNGAARPRTQVAEVYEFIESSKVEAAEQKQRAADRVPANQGGL